MKDIREVEKNIERYFAENLPRYDVLRVTGASDYKEDDYLYMVVAKNRINGKYAVWTSWNESIQSLNFGHYDIPDIGECEKILWRFYKHTEDSKPTYYRKVLIIDGFLSGRLFITDAPEKEIRAWCRNFYLSGTEPWDFWEKGMYYYKLLLDADNPDDEIEVNVDVVGYDEVYDLRDFR